MPRVGHPPLWGTLRSHHKAHAEIGPLQRVPEHLDFREFYDAATATKQFRTRFVRETIHARCWNERASLVIACDVPGCGSLPVLWTANQTYRAKQVYNPLSHIAKLEASGSRPSLSAVQPHVSNSTPIVSLPMK